jgi:hypothetical protein
VSFPAPPAGVEFAALEALSVGLARWRKRSVEHDDEAERDRAVLVALTYERVIEDRALCGEHLGELLVTVEIGGIDRFVEKVGELVSARARRKVG